MIDTLTKNPEYEQQPNREIEKKFIPLFPEKLAHLRERAQPIEQLYLSHPDEPYSLRLRQTVKNGELAHFATLKDNGKITEAGLDRMEVETEISQEAYEFYRSPETPVVRKLRTKITEDITIDWFEDGYVQVENESPAGWESFLERYNLNNQLVEVTGDRQSNNEWRAHYLYRLTHDGRETLTPDAPIDTEQICQSVLYRGDQSTLIRVTGRSGSGKSTIVRELEQHLRHYGIDSTTLSTDDYSKGKKFLDAHKGAPWDNWDDPFVYDTDQTAADIDQLLQGKTIARTQLDFTTQEPRVGGIIEPARVIIVEGIYAGVPAIATRAHLAYTVPTGIATATGRRLHRDFTKGERITEALPTPEAALRQIIENAEPAYRAQKAL